MTGNTRLEELQSKDVLTTAELEELIRLSPPETFKTLSTVATLINIGVTDLSKAMANFDTGAEKSRIAMDNGCYMEVISLRLQHSELMTASN